ncbi:hypothetical protein [Streptomyces sp. UG1]|uniref:hypothetical protein n=1 Tax=Streptomyces sp. UG1 TaxID=3417652 RepID=UPI003CEE7F55
MAVVVHVADPAVVPAGGVPDGRDGVLGEGAGLDDHRALGLGGEVHQFDGGRLRVDGGDQRGDLRRQTGAAGLGVVVAQPGLLQAAVVEHLGAAPGQLDEGFGDHRVAQLPHVDVGLGHVQVAVAVHPPQPVADLGLRGGEYALGVAGVVAGEEREPGLLVPRLLLGPERTYGTPVDAVGLAQPLQPGAVCVGGRVVPQGHRHGRGERVVVEPARVVVPEGKVRCRGVDVGAEFDHPLRGEAGVRVGVGHHLGVTDEGVERGRDHGEVVVVPGDRRRRERRHTGRVTHAVPAVRPGPAVVAAVPAALQQAAHDTVRARVVRDEATVGTGALAPRAHVLDDPVAVAVFARQDPRVEDQPGRGQVDRGVADTHPVPHLRAEPRVRGERVRAALRLGDPLQREAVRLRFLRQPGVHVAVEQARAVGVAAVVRAGDDTVLGVVVALGRVDVQLGK